jgi:hypothetical protein
MKYSEIKKKATDRLTTDLFNLAGYKLKKGGLGGGFNFRNSNKENRIFIIGCGMSIYGETSILRHISAGIIFLEIEEIFAPLVAKNGLMGADLKSTDNSTIGIPQIPGFENRDYTKYNEDLTITDEIGVDILVDRIKEYYYEFAAPAFDSFTSIEQFVPIIESMTIIELSDYFGSGAIFKKAIIYRLCNHKDYEQYISERIQLLKQRLDGESPDVKTINWYKTAIELKEILDSTPPKYNI